MIGAYRRIEPPVTGPRKGLSYALAAPAGQGAHPAYAAVALHYVGVCQSDLKELRGERHRRRDFGHELVGRVVETRPAGLLQPGGVVCLDPHVSVHRTSGFAEYVELAGAPETVRAALIDLPCEEPAPLGVFTEPLACACHCLSRLAEETSALNMPQKEPVLIVGAGMAGILMALALQEQGVEVTIANRSKGRLEFLRQHEVLPETPMLTFEQTTAASPRRIHRRAVIATATARPDILQWTIRHTVPGGLIMLYAGTAPGDRHSGADIDAVRRGQSRTRISRHGGSHVLAGSHGADQTDFATAIDLLWSPDGIFGDRVLRTIERNFPLRDAPAQLTAASHGGLIGKHIVVTKPPPRETP